MACEARRERERDITDGGMIFHRCVSRCGLNFTQVLFGKPQLSTVASGLKHQRQRIKALISCHTKEFYEAFIQERCHLHCVFVFLNVMNTLMYFVFVVSSRNVLLCHFREYRKLNMYVTRSSGS